MRLIDANALKARWYEINDIDETDRGARFVGYTEIARLIDHAPTIDAVPREDYISMERTLARLQQGIADATDTVEVVQCKDCHWYKKPYCDMHNGEKFNDNDFCSYGERSE